MGPTCAVYGRSKLTDKYLLQIDNLLSNLTSAIKRTRKIRVWDVLIDGRPIHVRVEITNEVLWDCEHELLELDTVPSDMPFRIVLTAGLNGREDYDLLSRLALRLAPLVNGVPTNPEK